MAIYTLPTELLVFYKHHLQYIVQHAVDADKRRYIDQNEAPRHYIDVEFYTNYSTDSIPRNWKKAVAKFSEDSLHKHGIAPWHLELMVHQLTEAMKEENTYKILKLSADIGHYLADIHVPLHTTRNYNGQFTQQKGIHAFWESRIPELYGEQYNFFAGKTEYIKHPRKLIWDIVQQSHAAVDSVLRFERELNEKFSPDKKYTFVDRGTNTVKNYSEAYTAAYNKMLTGQVERRMLSAIFTIGCVWYTCWVNAGKPDLKKTENLQLSDSIRKRIREEEQVLKNYKGRKSNLEHDEHNE